MKTSGAGMNKTGWDSTLKGFRD